MADEPLRHVIREHRFERELRALIPDGRKADEFIEAAEYVIARDPHAGICLPLLEPPLWLMPLPLIGGEQVSLFYTFDETTVTFVSIQRL